MQEEATANKYRLPRNDDISESKISIHYKDEEVKETVFSVPFNANVEAEMRQSK